MTPEDTTVSGSLRALLLFDIAEEIDLPLLRRLFGSASTKREPAFRQPAPEYVRFERPPVIEHLGVCQTEDGKELQARLRYFDYGVASVELRMHFRESWGGLGGTASRWIMSLELEGRASALLRERLAGISEALNRPYEARISEDYYVIQVDPPCPSW